ncbi:MAG: DUF2818 family protein [Comamonadaceae bacterium]|nr:MAG: DUF2818 family protein [Comamonadaceae bacterium]
MSQTVSIWLVLLVAFIAANLPFVSQRIMAVVPWRQGKTLFIRLLELIAFYFVAGGFGLLLENRGSQIAPQTWEFYAITGALFITLAFPGFIWRYLLKHRN